MRAIAATPYRITVAMVGAPVQPTTTHQGAVAHRTLAIALGAMVVMDAMERVFGTG
jgi:hypothetical protein